MAIKRGGHGSETMLDLVTTELDLSEKTLLRQTIYNIAGWLEKEVEKKHVLLSRMKHSRLDFKRLVMHVAP